MSADAFETLHRGPAPLLLPNAWDAGSARLFDSLGAAAIATTSAGLAWSRGYPDGDALSPDELIAAARGIARVVRVPLSIDIEGGYSDDPAAVATLAARVVDAGVVGINIEDGRAPPRALADKIAAIRGQRATAIDDLFVNARTDVCLRGLASGQAAVDEVIARAALYRDAGCSGLFVPGLADPDAIAAIARAIDPLPLNVMLVPGLPSVERLARLGVRRLSAGAAIAQAAFGHAGRLASGFLASGQVVEGATDTLDYGAINRLFAPA